MEKNNYDKKQLDELKEINFWFIVNTIFTIITGLATLGLGVLEFLSRN